MTVASTNNRISFDGDGIVVEFPINFGFQDNGDIKVILKVDSTGVETTQVETTDYTLTGAGIGSIAGTLTMIVAPADGETLVVKRDIDITQNTDYENNDNFPADSHEAGLDKLTQINQQQTEEIGRSIRLPESSEFSDLSIPDPVALQFLRWSSDADSLENVNILSIDDTIVLPSVSVDGNVAAFDGTTGVQLKDGGINISQIVTLTGTQVLTNKTLTNPTIAVMNGLTKLAIGNDENTINIGGVTFDSTLSVHAEGMSDLAGVTLHRHSNVAGMGSHLLLSRSRGTEAAMTIVQNNDVVARIDGLGFDGTDYALMGQIDFEIDGTPSDGADMPGRIIIKTTPDGSATPIEVIRFSQDRTIKISGTLDVNAQNITTTSGDITFIPFTTAGNIIFDFTGTTGGSAFNINLADDTTIEIDGRTQNRSVDTGIMRFLHTPSIVNTRSITHDVDMNSLANTHAVVIEYKATGLAAGEVGVGYAFNIDTNTSTGGVIRAHEVTRAGAGSAEVHALHADPGVVAIFQNVGTFAVADDNFTVVSGGPDVATNRDTAFNTDDSGGPNDVAMFVNDNDYVMFNKSTAYNAIEWILETIASGAGIQPDFEFATADDTWTAFTATDDTNGMRQTGTTTWIIANLSGWVSTTQTLTSTTGFHIRVLRRRNSLSTPPVETTVKISATNTFQWNETGDVTINSLIANGGITVDNTTLDGDVLLSTGALGLTATDAALNVIVGTGASDDFTINATGFVYEGDTGFIGVNTADPDVRLHVLDSGTAVSGVTASAIFQCNTTTATNCNVAIISGSAGNSQLLLGDADGVSQGIINYDNNTNSLSLVTNTAPAIFMTSGQLVGVNTTAPDVRLHVLDSGTAVSGVVAVAIFQANTAANTNAQIAVIAGTTGNARVVFGDSENAAQGFIDYDNNDDSLSFLTDATLGLRISSSQVITMASLAGSGTRNVVVDANGVLSAP
jgi:hypothetical protein